MLQIVFPVFLHSTKELVTTGYNPLRHTAMDIVGLIQGGQKKSADHPTGQRFSAF